MKPVTEKDIARFAAGHVIDEAEIDRIMEAITRSPELEDLFHLLSEPVELSFEETPPAQLDAMRQRLQLLMRTRLWPLAKNPFFRAGNKLEPVSAQTHLSTGHVACEFKPVEGTEKHRLNCRIPDGYELLDVIAAQFSLAPLADPTLIHTPPAWKTPLPKPLTDDTAERQLDVKQAPMHLGAAEAPVESSPKPSLGGSFQVTAAEYESGTVLVTGPRDTAYPRPVLVTSHFRDGHSTTVARLLRSSREEFKDLFPDAIESLEAIELDWLRKPEELAQLSAADAAELLASVPFTVAAVKQVASDEYEVDLTDSRMVKLLSSGATSFCLAVAPIEPEVQP